MLRVIRKNNAMFLCCLMTYTLVLLVGFSYYHKLAKLLASPNKRKVVNSQQNFLLEGFISANCTGHMNPNISVACSHEQHFSINPKELLKSYKIRWQMVSTVYPERVQVYSAYYDDRFDQFVIIYWCEWDYINWKLRFPYQLVCIFFDANMVQSKYVDGVQSTRYFLFCKPPKSFIPKYVVVLKNETRSIEELRFHIIPITNVSRMARVKKGDLGVCLTTIAHYNGEYLMPSQSVESYLLQGASKIYFYYQNSLAPIRKLFDLYARQGKIILVPWRGGELCSAGISFFCQLAMIQDCMYRLRYEYETVIVGDQDELIWSHNKPLVEFVREKFENPLVGAVVFRQRFFPRTHLEPEWSTTENRIRSFYVDHLPFTKYRNISAIGWPGHGTKYIVRPALVQKLWVHYAAKYVNTNVTTINADPSEAYLRHYRNWTEYRNSSKHDVYKFGNFSIENLSKFGKTFEDQLVDKVSETFMLLQKLWYDLFEEAEFWTNYETYKVDKVITKLH